MSQDGPSPQEVYRQGLSAAIGAICLECGCEAIQKSALETLTEIFQSYLTEIGRSTRQYCEVGGRAIPTLCDVQAALADVGFKISTMPDYIRRPKRVSVGDVQKSAASTSPNVLNVGERKNFPSHIPESSNYPKFPDPHTYVRTLTGQESETQYGILREHSSSQRWDVERALTRFMAKTGSSHPLLPDDRNALPLIAAVPSPIPYLAALLSSENENVAKLPNSDSQESTSESELEQGIGVRIQIWNENKWGPTYVLIGQVEKGEKRANKSRYKNKEYAEQESPKKTSTKAKLAENIDNPYLRPAKVPKMKKRQR